MAKSLNQKEKLLRIVQILEEKTDENHALSTRALIDELKTYDIEAERKSIYDDIMVLQNMGYDIRLDKSRTGGGYSLLSRRLEKSEILPLVDAISCSRFITEKKSRELIKKLEGFLSIYEAGELNRNVYVSDRIKTDNESIFYVVDGISTALIAHKAVSFLYCEWNIKKELVARKDGKEYRVYPITLAWDDEKYYLIGIDLESGNIKHYRCDKIKNVSIIEEDNILSEEHKKIISDFQAVKYENKTFGMYGGHEETVTLTFPERFCGVMIDRFGKEPTLRKEQDNLVSIRVNVNVSSQFFGWLSGLGNDVKIKAPQNVRDEYVDYIRNILDGYKI